MTQNRRNEEGVQLWYTETQYRLLPESSHDLYSMSVCVLIPFSFEDSSQAGLGLILMAPFNINYLCKDIIF